MRYRLICDVEGGLFLHDSKKQVVELDGIRYELIPNRKNRVKKVAVSLQVSNRKRTKFTSSVKYQAQGKKLESVQLGRDEYLHNQLIEALKRLESLLSIGRPFPAIHRIRWDFATEQYIPESPDDDKLISIREIGRSPRTIEHTTIIDENLFPTLLKDSQALEPLKVLASFWRESFASMWDGQYIRSIYNMYFIIEDIYAGNNFAEEDVLKAFEASEELTHLIEMSLIGYPKLSAVDMAGLLQLLKDVGVDWDVRGVMLLMIRMRNRIHHYKSIRQRPDTRLTTQHGTPFNNAQFRPLAFLLQYIVSLVLRIHVGELTGVLHKKYL